MSHVTSSSPARSPLGLESRSLIWQLGAVVFGTAFLALSSQISVPMIPVPVTMQTFAVCLIGAVYGPRLGAITICAWLIEGAAGLPVFASGTGGLARFLGSTGGYLLAFPIAGAVTGWLVAKGWNGQRMLLAFAAMMIGHAICLGVGAAWLATQIGFSAALIHGVVPFLVGSVLKSALGAAALKLIPRSKAASA